MNDSLRIGSIFGITIRIHVLFVVLIGLLVLQSPNPAWTATYLGMLMLIVFLHELGHSLTAQSFGIRVLDITFWPLGGMANMSQIPEDSRVEGLIAIAGPAVNFVLALAASLLGLLLMGSEEFARQLELISMEGLNASLLGTFIAINLALGIFNLLPAFPMDGGRVLRAVLARRSSWVDATQRAVSVSRVLAVVMGVWGLDGNIWLTLIAVFVWVFGSRELRAMRLRHQGHPFRPDSMLGSLFENMQRAAEAQQRAAEEYARRQGGGDEPMAEGAPFSIESDVESTGGGRPSTGGRGFSDEDVRRLESFQGRLRRPGRDQGGS